MPLNLKPKYKPVVLAIIDGWGLSTKILGNPLTSATDNLQKFWLEYPHLALKTFEKTAGSYPPFALSEEGHLSIGGGRIVKTELAAITDLIENGLFFRNPIFLETCRAVKSNRSNLHLLGLLSKKGIDSHIDHLIALLELAKAEKIPQVFIHLFIEETDSQSEILGLLANLEAEIQHIGIGKIATVSGINFATETKNLDPLKVLLKTLLKGKGETAKTVQIPDNLTPTSVRESDKESPILLKDRDSIIFFNLKADKIKGVIKGLFDPDWFSKLKIESKERSPSLLGVSLADYFLNLPIKTAFRTEPIKNSLSELIAQNHLKQLKATLSQKFPHLTYYFNGRRKDAFAEEKSLVIGTISSNPNRDLPQLINGVLNRLKNFDLIILNIPNLDLAGHTLDSQLIYETSRLVDKEVYRLAFATVKTGGALILTSDHGNVETTSEIHSLNPVPLILITPENRKNLLSTAIQSVLSRGLLADIIGTRHTIADIAPTVLDLLNLKTPPEMTGKSLLPFLGFKKVRV